MTENILIIGGGSGIGNELLKKYTKMSNVFTTYRNNKPTIKECKSYRLDLGNIVEIQSFVRKLKYRNIKFDQILFIAAYTGTYKLEKNKNTKASFMSSLSKKLFEFYLKVNCINPVIFFELLLKNQMITDNCKVIFFSSLAGSIESRGKLRHNKTGGNIMYRVSKSALNSAIKNIAYDLSETSIVVIALHPGWVRTNSGGKTANLSIGYSSKKIYELISKIKKKDSGNFLNYDGRKIKW
tara:strand:+ start:926 stop:1642 length:717 start_codon:yes stop_codon:yes gene_type:complete